MTDRVVKKCGIGKNPGSGWGLFFNGIKYLPVILERSEESGQRLQVLNTFLQLSYAGFFAKSHIMFFLLSSFRFLPPLKNDGRGVAFFMVLHSCPSFSNEVKNPGKESGQRIRVLNTLFAIIPCRILRYS